MAITSTAPYTSGQAVLTIIQRFRDKGLTTPITADVLVRAGVSDSLVPRTLPALILLELIDETGMPTPTFQKIRVARHDEYQACLAEWLRSVYAEVFQFVDPGTDDVVRIRDAFRTYTPHGQQDRMVSLFLALCAEAGLATETKKAESKPAARKPAVPRASVPRQTKAARVRTPPPPPLLGGLNALEFPPVLAGMLQSIPTNGKGWTQEERDRFMATFSAVLDFSVPVIIGDRSADEVEEEMP